MFFKKLLTAGIAVCAISLSSAAAEEKSFSISFSNKLGSDIVDITSEKTKFAGLYNKLEAKLSSEKVDVGIKAKILMGTDGDGVPESFMFEGKDSDWYAVFRPVNILSLGFSADTHLSGSYLAVEDENISGGNLGSDGFSINFTGVKNLTLAATIPFGIEQKNWFKQTVEPSNNKKYLDMGFGAEYNFNEKAAIGALVRNVLNNDDTGFGVYAAVFPAEGLSLYGGYAYKDNEGLCDVAGTNMFNASISFENDTFLCAADYITTSDIFYAAGNFGLFISEEITLELGGTVNATYKETAKGIYVIKPAVTYNAGSTGEFKAEVDISFEDKSFSKVCFPVYWKYSFKN